MPSSQSVESLPLLSIAAIRKSRTAYAIASPRYVMTIESLDEFESSLSGRVQFLLDAAVGFISMEQNDVVKVLTVVSVAGVPPVLVAGVYGMNFITCQNWPGPGAIRSRSH